MNNLETPCFVIDYQSLVCNISVFKQALGKRFMHNVLGYSVKTNSIPSLLDLIKECGCYAEVVSYNEYRLAVSRGFLKQNIIYNGPLKSKETFLDALKSGSFVNIETKREIEWLAGLPKNKQFHVGIRINLNLSKIAPSDCDSEEEYSRFGFSYENGELGSAIEQITSYENVVLDGLHLHRTSKTRSLNVYKSICLYALKIIGDYNLKLRYIDVGGGYFGDMPGKPTYIDYVNCIHDVLSSGLDCEKLILLVEPGNALIASPVSYYSEIIDVKNIDGVKILVSDATRNDVDPFFHKTDYFKDILSEVKDRACVPRQVYVGCTCLETDRLFEMYDAPEMRVGDRVKFSFVGAYTSCLSPLFIRYFPRVYLYRNGEYEEIREEWTEKEYVQLSK